MFALAEKVEKKNDLLIPDTSIRSDVGSVLPKRPAITTPPVEAIQPQPVQGGFLAGESTEEEGC